MLCTPRTAGRLAPFSPRRPSAPCICLRDQLNQRFLESKFWQAAEWTKISGELAVQTSSFWLNSRMVLTIFYTRIGVAELEFKTSVGRWPETGTFVWLGYRSFAHAGSSIVLRIPFFLPRMGSFTNPTSPSRVTFAPVVPPLNTGASFCLRFIEVLSTRRRRRRVEGTPAIYLPRKPRDYC